MTDDDDDREPKTLVVRCTRCESHQVGEVMHCYRDGEDDDPTTVYRYLFARCPRCNGPFLLMQVGDWNYRHDVVSWGNARYLYPAEPDFLDLAVPQPIANSYLEARRTFNDAGAATAAAIMCRRTLEGITLHFQAQGRNLHERLRDLKSRGVVDARLHEWADHALRGLGNDAAHDVNAMVSREDARDALEFTRAIIEYLFVFADAFHRFKTRREEASIAKQQQSISPSSGQERAD
jgi:hypothetical protein